MYYIKKLVFLKKKIIIFNYFYGTGSGYPRVIEYRDRDPKSGYPETTNPDPNIIFTDPTDPDPDTPNFPDIWKPRIRIRILYSHIRRIRIRVPRIFRISGSILLLICFLSRIRLHYMKI